MRCEDLREWLSAELDGEAGPVERQAVRQHLAVCVTCRQARAAAEGLRERLAQIGPGEADPAGPGESLFARLRRDGVIRDPASPLSLQEKLRRRGARLLAEGASAWGPSLRPALAALAVSFLLTWASMRWVESDAGKKKDRPEVATASAPAPTPAADMLERWLDGPPTLAALAQVLPPAPRLPRLPQRSDRLRPRRRLG